MPSALLLALALATSEAPVAPREPVAPVASSPPAPVPPSTTPATSVPQAAPKLDAAPAALETPASGPEAPVGGGVTAPKPKGGSDAVTEDDRPVTTPRSLTRKAFEEEVHQTVRQRRTERARAGEERTRLEKLASDIASARAALKEETARLEQLAKKESASSASTASDAGDKASVAALARTLKGMRPEQAAAVLGRLDKKLAVELLRRLRPADAGVIAEKLRPEAAAELFALMARPAAGESR